MKRRVLLKVSGEALKGDSDGSFEATEVARVGNELQGAAVHKNVSVAVVVGGGNIIRGAQFHGGQEDPTRGDYMGMMATLINALALRDSVEAAGGKARVMAPFTIPNVAQQYNRAEAVMALDAGEIVIFGGGTGHPFFTTDTTAALRAAEIGAEVVLKGSNVDGIYDADPRSHPDAKRYDEVSFDEVIEKRLGVMDQTAFTLCRDRGIQIRVFDMGVKGAIQDAAGDHPPGTLVHDK